MTTPDKTNYSPASYRKPLRKGSVFTVLVVIAASIQVLGSGSIRSLWTDDDTKALDEVWTEFPTSNDAAAKAHGETVVDKSVTNNGVRVSHEDTINIPEIVKRWELATQDAGALLERQYRRGFDYDAERDFVHFHHLHKCGGTSVSDLMEKIFGKNVLPGSARSGLIDVNAVSGAGEEPPIREKRQRRRRQGAQQQHVKADAQQQHVRNYSVSFAHSSLRPTTGPNRTPLAKLLQTLLPDKKLRAITMLRDPVSLRASNHAMWMCALNAAVRDNNKRRKKLGLSPQCGDVNLTALIDIRVDQLRQRCADGNTKGGDKKNCEKLNRGIDPFSHCRSARDLLGSKSYANRFHNMYKIVMGRYTRNGVVEAMKGFFAHDRGGADEKGATVEEVEKYTLEDLGGLEPNVESSRKEEADFLWFGITERMFESTCLFYYTFRVDASTIERVPTARVMGCRPTAWWTDEDKDEVRRKEPLDYAVFRAANAIMDVRLAKMFREIQDQLEGGATLESLRYVAPGCFNLTTS